MTKIRMLLVDDNPEYLSNATAVLAGTGHEVLAYGTASEAIRQINSAANEKLNLVITDFDPNENGTDGLAVAKAAVRKDISRVIIHTAQPYNVPRSGLGETVEVHGKMSRNELLGVVNEVVLKIDQTLRDARNSNRELH